MKESVKLNNKQKIGLILLVLAVVIGSLITYYFQRDITNAILYAAPWIIIIRLYYENYKLKQELKSYQNKYNI